MERVDMYTLFKHCPGCKKTTNVSTYSENRVIKRHVGPLIPMEESYITMKEIVHNHCKECKHSWEV